MASRRPAPRPKRAGEEFARTHDFSSSNNNGENTGSSSSKKLRFDVRNPSALAPDALEDDVFLEADEIGKRGLGTKRNAVQVDGYGSDSSNEGFDGRAEAKARKGEGKKGSKDEEDNDMFADLEERADGDEDDDAVKKTQGGKEKGRNVRFLGEDEIEGQVLGSRSGGHVSADFSVTAGTGGSRNGIADHVRGSGNIEEDSEESDVDDSLRADIGTVDEEIGAGGKKEHAPKLDAFNMKNEQEEGRFDDQGNFVRKAADADAVHDSWLEGVSKKDMKRAKEAAERRDDAQRQKQREDDALLTSDILATLIQHLEKGETPLEALARLGKAKAKSKSKSKTKLKNQPKWKKNKPQTSASDDPMNLDSDPPPPPEPEPEVQAIESITTATNTLFTRGRTEIYDLEREGLIRLWSRETGETWTSPPPASPPSLGDGGAEAGGRVEEGKMWEYRWRDKRDGGEAHGPYGGDVMRGWVEADYFGVGGVEVEVREVLGDSGKRGEGEWRRW